ncbi:MAG: hypothetical protein P8X53_14765 [Chromatiales bacterium]
MKRRIAQYLNEIVSITIMLLMTIAFIAGQASPMSIGADERSDRIPYQSARVSGDDQR